jgi:hypothetical protein
MPPLQIIPPLWHDTSPLASFSVPLFLRGQADDDEAADPEKIASEHSPLFWKPVLLTVGGLATMAVGGPAVVEGALRLTQATELSQGVVGATIVSLGTGAEMIALGVSAARKKRPDILVGGFLAHLPTISWLHLDLQPPSMRFQSIPI